MPGKRKRGRGGGTSKKAEKEIPKPDQDKESAEDLEKILEMSRLSAKQDDERRKKLSIDSDEELNRAIELSLLDSSVASQNSSRVGSTSSDSQLGKSEPSQNATVDLTVDSSLANQTINLTSEIDDTAASGAIEISDDDSFGASATNQVPVVGSPIMIDEEVSCQSKDDDVIVGDSYIIPDDSTENSDSDSDDKCDDEEYWSCDSAEKEFQSTCDTLLGLGASSSYRRRNFNGACNRPGNDAVHPAGNRLDSDAATQRFRQVYSKALENKLNNLQMEPCKAIRTKLHPHQKVALAWMSNQENTENKGMMGGILADDMGLGKTCTVISLIMTNNYDGRPLAKPNYGYTRNLIDFGRRRGGSGRGSRTILNPEVSKVGMKINNDKKPVFNFFSNKKDDTSSESDDEDVKPFTFDESVKKAAMRKRNRKNFIKDDDSTTSESGEESDEFDAMLKESRSKTSLKDKFKEGNKTKKRNSEDEELDEVYEQWQKMTDEEKSARMRSHTKKENLDPKLNVDGAWDSDSEEDVQLPRKKNKLNAISSDEEETVNEKRKYSSETTATDPKRMKIIIDDDDSDSDVKLSDIELEDDLFPSNSSAYPTIPIAETSHSAKPVPKDIEKQKPTENIVQNQPVASTSRSVQQPSQINRIVPPREPAVRGNRARPTLIVCPTSLLGHWIHEIDTHVDRSVPLKVFVHYGQRKAKIAAELNANDIVLTTYGSLASECDNEDDGPLLKAKWLRVVLDEGHYIKNHRTKAAKASNKLNTKRRWVVTGTPIQNNLIEFWSLVNWLQFDLYAGDLAGFKYMIERPCKNRDEEGFVRLQTLMDSICLRRTKNDKRENGEPIVKLPVKTIILREIQFSEEEQLCYDVMKHEASKVVERYRKQGSLMRNYAHIFAMMTRLRQMCCHRELIDFIDWNSTLKDRENLRTELARFAEAEANHGGVNPDDPNSAESAKRLADQLRQMISDGVTDDCSICLEDLKSPVITACAHVYCKGCIEMVIDTTKPPLCPLCRGQIKKTELLKASEPDDEEKEANTANESKSKDFLDDLKKIEFDLSSSKVNAAIKEMIRIREANSEDKMIVVSQFTSFLSIVQILLKENGFRFVRLDGTMSQIDRKETIDIFQTKGSNTPTVMLLSLKAGGVGLNLTAANHLLLLDPAWNPASESQVFDRIHRIGQEKDVFIYKYVTQGESIEETMLQIQEKKKNLIDGAFHMPDEDRRRQRIDDILNIFNLQPRGAQQH